MLRFCGDASTERIKEASSFSVIRLQESETRKPGVACAEIVERDAKAELAKLADAGLQSRHPIQRGPFGELEDHSVRDLAEGRRRGKEIEVIEVFRVNIDEEQHGLRKPTASAATRERSFEPLRASVPSARLRRKDPGGSEV